MNKQMVSMLDEASVKRAYARWAPVYDLTFGKVTECGRARAVDVINTLDGRVLEAGVGTGMSLPRYRRDLKVTGIDLSAEMLDLARRKVSCEALGHVEQIAQMDAADMSFVDDSFDAVAAMYVMTVVPDPQKVLNELVRVCRPGGTVLIISHFSQTGGVRGAVEKAMAPFASRLGWRPEFPISVVLGHEQLRLVDIQQLNPFGLFTLLRFLKR